MGIQINIPSGYSWFFIDEIPDGVEQRLTETFRYRHEDAEYVDSYNSGDWDGYINVYHPNKNGGPVGLLSRVTEIIRDEGYDVDVNWQGDRTGDPVDLDWQFDGDLRDYQKAAVMALMAEGGGVVSLPTGTGKTVTALNYCYYEREQVGRPIIFVHSKNLLYQWEEQIEDILGVEPGLIGDGHESEGPVTVAIMQSLLSKGIDGTLTKNYGIGIWDECHITSGAEQMSDIRMDIDVAVTVGLSATPWRSMEGAELVIEGVVGDETYGATAEEMIDEAHMAVPCFEEIDSSDEWPTPSHGDEYNEAYERCITFNGKRNHAVACKAEEMAADNNRQVLISVDRLDHGGEIADYFIGANTDVYTLYGDDDKESRDRVFDEFGKGDVLISTLLREGVDIPELDALVIAHAQKSDITMIQTVGRALRPTEGTLTADIVHVHDRGRWFGNAYLSRQGAMNNYYGSYGPDQ